nr:MAG TPA: 30S ribosomal protein S2 [Caudoviricetes sp.]
MVGEDEKTREMVDAIVKSGDTVQNILIRLQQLADECGV